MEPSPSKKSRRIDNSAPHQPTLLDVADIVLSSGFVPWYTAVRVGATNMELRHLWKDHESKPGVWDELLALLNRINDSNKCPFCEGVLFPASDEPQCAGCTGEARVLRQALLDGPDPRSRQSYDAMSTDVKCMALTWYTSVLMTRFRSCIDYNQMTDEFFLPNGFNEWDWGNHPDLVHFYKKKPKRCAFIRCLIAHAMARSDLATFFSQVEDVLDESFDITEPMIHEVESFDTVATSIFHEINPCMDEDIETFIQSEYESEADRNLLGPVLTKKLLFFAPFFDDSGAVVLPAFEDQDSDLPDLLDVCDIVLQAGFLPWHEAIRIGRVNKGLRVVWKQYEDTLDVWDDLLELLDRMNSFNKCPDCCGTMFPASNSSCRCNTEEGLLRRNLENNPDPRSADNYEEWPTHFKCQELAGFTGFMVQNFRSYIDYDRMTDEAALPNGYREWIWSNEVWEALDTTNPKRSTFIRFLMVHSMARYALSHNMLFRFEEAFFGVGFEPNRGNSFLELTTDLFEYLFPGRDKSLEESIQGSYESQAERDLLGPVLSRDLLFFAPFFDDNGILLLPDFEEDDSDVDGSDDEENK